MTTTTAAATITTTVQRTAYPARLVTDLREALATTAVYIDTFDGTVRVLEADQTSSGYTLLVEDVRDAYAYRVDLDADRMIVYTVADGTNA